MPHPRLEDDGTTVVLDLHGASVADALALARATVREAARRGRTYVRLIHGGSARRDAYRPGTIRQALHAWLDGRPAEVPIADAWRADGYLLLALTLPSHTDPVPIRLRDVQP